MKTYSISLALLLVPFFSDAQNAMQEEVKRISAEGKQLYYTEMGTRVATPLFEAKYKGKEKAEGVVAYTVNDKVHCVYYSGGEKARALATLDFDTLFTAEKVIENFTPGDLTEVEKNLIQIRTKAKQLANTDAQLRKADGCRFLFIPVQYQNKYWVYLIPESETDGRVVFGNDFLLEFDQKGNFKEKKSLHPNTIILKYGKEADPGQDPNGGTHVHYPETGDLITATDCCILMLNSKKAGWKQHSVISQNYISFFNCQNNEFIAIPKSGDGSDFKK